MDSELLHEAEKQGITRLITLGFDQADAFLRRSRARLDTTEDRIFEAISAHLAGIRSWSEEISFKDLQQPRATSEVFVPLDMYLLPRRSRFTGSEALRSVPLDHFLSASDDHLVVLGQPGAGKTTCVKHVCQQMLSGDTLSEDQEFPLLIRLRELNATRIPKNTDDCTLILERIQGILDITIEEPNNAGNLNAFDSRYAREKVVLTVLESLRPLILLDGLDEITHKRKRDAVVEELRRLAPLLRRARFLLTSRTGEFNYYIERMHAYEIAPLTTEQVDQFSCAWLGQEAASTFLQQIRRSPFWEAALKPLTLAHLCAIYERYKNIPDRPKTVYKKIVKLLLEEWDQQRSVVRKSAYAGFDIDRKEEFLADLAHCLSASQRSTEFSREDLLYCYSEIHPNYGMQHSDAQNVVDEIESHTGIIVQSASDLFEFSHKSLQEYLTALFIYGLPEIPSNMINLQLMPSELAIATALSSRPSQYFTKLVTEHFRSYKLSFSFIRTYVSRLLIERPDFENNAEVGIALLLLYSQYLYAVLSDTEQLKLFIDDYLEDEFRQLADLIRSRILLEEVLKAYDAFSHAYNGLGDQIWRLERKEEAQGSFALLARANVMPGTLWVRNSLLNPDGVKVEILTDGVALNMRGA